MKRLRVLILVFVMALAVPLGYLVFRTHRSLEQEETAELRFFANTLFDQMEQELAALVQREERRPVDEYLPSSAPVGSGLGEAPRSPLAQAAAEPYILGYLQNNPDGSFSTPLAEGGGAVAQDQAAVVGRLQDVNRIFNTKRTMQPESSDRQAVETVQKKTGTEPKDGAVKKEDVAAKKAEGAGFADKYLDVSRSAKQKAYLGQAEKRVEQISPQQAMNLAQRDEQQQAGGERTKTAALAERQTASGGKADALDAAMPSTPSAPAVASVVPPRSTLPQPAMPLSAEDGLRVEVDPLQSVHIDNGQVLLFRRIVIGNQVYRQGMVIRVGDLLKQLKNTHFTGQPMARFTSLTLTSVNGGRETARVQEGPPVTHPRFSLERSFPRPFSFVRATLTCEEIPRSPGPRNAPRDGGGAGRGDSFGAPCHLPQRPGGDGPLGAPKRFCLLGDPRTQDPAHQHPHVHRDAGARHRLRPGAGDGVLPHPGLGERASLQTHQQRAGVFQAGEEAAPTRPSRGDHWRRFSPKCAMPCRSGSARKGSRSPWKTFWIAPSGTTGR